MEICNLERKNEITTEKLTQIYEPLKDNQTPFYVILVLF